MSDPADRRAEPGYAAVTDWALAGEWDVGPITRRLRHGCGLSARRARRVALALVHGFPVRPADRRRDVRRFVAGLDETAHLGLRSIGAVGPTSSDAPGAHGLPEDTTPRSWLVNAPSAMGATPWAVPPLDSVADLADHLGLSVPRLQWFADVHGLERSVADEALRHYRRRWIPSRSGGRLLEIPKSLLRLFQRRVLHEILDAVPAHPAAHGFVRGRSVHSYVAPHVGRAVLVHLDLDRFFPSVGPGRVFGTFRACGYPEPVAHLLTGLCTTTTPAAVRAADPSGRRPGGPDPLRRPHLPQGAPTSPALANLAAHRLDIRLTGLASAFGARYTRYADDLAFSSDRPGLAAGGFLDAVAGIVVGEGFRLNPAKTRVASAGRQQRLTGLVVNHSATLDRRRWDHLKALFHDAATNGPDAANRDGVPAFRAHLLGLLSWAEQCDGARAGRLRADFDRIVW